MLEPEVILGMPKIIYDDVVIPLSKDKGNNIKDTRKDKCRED